MAEADRPPVDKAYFLAEWTQLSDETVKECYKRSHRAPAEAWEMLVAFAPPSLRVRAAEEADRHGFLQAFATAIADREREAGRSAQEITEMLITIGSYGQMQALTDPSRGFKNAAIFLPLLQASQACAIVWRTHPLPKQVGTAFLVRPDMVLTAAHVAIDVVDDGSGPRWADELAPGLEFHFIPRPTDDQASRYVVRPAVEKGALLNKSLPHGSPPDKLEVSLDARAAQQLDFALIRLAQSVNHVKPVELSEQVAVKPGKMCYAFGYPGGNTLVYDDNLVAEVIEPAGRWLHRANTDKGMSGGCCVNHEGQVAGLHEGSVEIEPVPGEPKQRLNRSISIAAIRRYQLAAGRDPFRKPAPTAGLEFASPGLVAGLYRAGLRLGGPGLAATWRELVTAALDVDPEAGDALPPFHPWLPRDQVENWILGTDPLKRLCAVYGEPGAGKSFCARILRERLDPSGTDFLYLSPTQTGAMGLSDAFSSAISDEDQSYRTAAATVRYSDIDAIVAELRRRSTDGQRKRWIALDFGRAITNRDLASGGWFTLIVTLLMNDWARVLVIDLDEAERLALQDQIFARQETADVVWTDARLDYLARADLEMYAIKLARARGKERPVSELRNRARSLLPDGTISGSLQTVAAVLAAIQLEKELR